MQILINLALLAVALAVVATLACIAAGRDGRLNPFARWRFPRLRI